ncbi:N-methyl-L-tryptophan oxidase [Paenibacillus filicis]|uniref:N-methyl-L-tryptophan oxidase n=1 Tax=Paenibacillus filicis TaxID=669464 RepID=A0ABU9DM11_9BACL
MRTTYDVIIAGAGSMGMSAGYYLAQRNLHVLLIDRFDPPHTSGSHNGDTRLIRHAYPGSLTYTEMALRSDQLWTELEEASGETLLVRSGVLNLGSEELSMIGEKKKRAQQFGLDVELVSAADISVRWPGIALPAGYAGVYERNAGYLFSEACVRAYRQQALALGAELLPNTAVTGIQAGTDGSVSVQTSSGTFSAKKAVVSLGAWFGGLEGLPPLPIRPVRKAVGWFEAPEALYDVAHFPGFTITDTSGAGFYGFPSVDGSGVKIGRHDRGQDWAPGQPFEPFGHYPEDEAELRAGLEALFPQAAGRLLRGAVCKYEFTPDEDFIIDLHPQNRNIVIAGGFSGHGFKFASAVGEIAADLLTEGRSRFDLSPFSLGRFGSL